IDIALSFKKGLAVIVIAFALANAALAWFAVGHFGTALVAHCKPPFPAAIRIETALRAACANPDLTRLIASACLLGLTCLLYGREFWRGITDRGFVGGSLRVERNRRRGI